MRKVTVSRMRERYAQTVLTFLITYIYIYIYREREREGERESYLLFLETNYEVGTPDLQKGLH